MAFVAAWAADLAVARARRRRAQDLPTLVSAGVRFPVPPRRHRDQGAYYRDRLLRLRDRSPLVHWPYPRALASPDPADLHAPMVLATFHMGPLAALGGLIERLPGPVCVLLGAGQVVTRRARYVRTLGGEQQRAAAVVEALHTLRAGGYALVVVDGVGTGLVQTTVLGRPVSLAAGAFALARLADAPLLPVAVRWRGAAVEIVAGEQIAPTDDAAMATALVAWARALPAPAPGRVQLHAQQAPGDPLAT